MRHINTDGVAWSVGLSVCHSREPCKNGSTVRGAVWEVDSGWPKQHACISCGCSLAQPGEYDWLSLLHLFCYFFSA